MAPIDQPGIKMTSPDQVVPDPWPIRGPTGRATTPGQFVKSGKGNKEAASLGMHDQIDGATTAPALDMVIELHPVDLAKRIKEYTLSINVCEGEDSEKMNWFRIVNIAGVKLTEQELRNSLYTGPWLTEAKRYFSRTGQAAAAVADGYHNVKVNRQELLEKAISWAAGAKDDQSIMEYMSRHQKDTEVDEL